MEKFLPWFVSVLTGLMIILILNLSPLAHFGFGVSLSHGWSGTRGQYNCTGQVVNGCGDCGGERDGLPFVFSRRLPETCFFESNRVAWFLDALFGGMIGGLGMIYILSIDKHEEKHSD